MKSRDSIGHLTPKKTAASHITSSNYIWLKLQRPGPSFCWWVLSADIPSYAKPGGRWRWGAVLITVTGFGLCTSYVFHVDGIVDRGSPTRAPGFAAQELHVALGKAGERPGGLTGLTLRELENWWFMIQFMMIYPRKVMTIWLLVWTWKCW